MNRIPPFTSTGTYFVSYFASETLLAPWLVSILVCTWGFLFCPSQDIYITQPRNLQRTYSGLHGTCERELLVREMQKT